MKTYRIIVKSFTGNLCQYEGPVRANSAQEAVRLFFRRYGLVADVKWQGATDRINVYAQCLETDKEYHYEASNIHGSRFCKGVDGSNLKQLMTGAR